LRDCRQKHNTDEAGHSIRLRTMAVYDQDEFELIFFDRDEHYFDSKALCATAAPASRADVRLHTFSLVTVCGADEKRNRRLHRDRKRSRSSGHRALLVREIPHTDISPVRLPELSRV